jgi:hypothetical protein
MSVSEFRPLALRNVRDAMIRAGRCRTVINKDVHRIRAIFRWAVAEELVPAEQRQALKAVEPLREGRTMAKEAEKVEPVPLADVEATIAKVSPVIG